MIQPFYQDESCSIYHGDCREVLRDLDPVDLVVTSPPYADQRDYGFEAGTFDWANVVPAALSSLHLTDDAQVLVNLGLVHRDGEVIQYWDVLLQAMRSAGLRFFGWYVWDKGPGLPGDWNGRLAPAHEFVFHFNRSARRPAKCVPCVSLRRDGAGGLRSRDGSIAKWSGDPKAVSPFRIMDSVLRLNPQKARNGYEVEHPAVFPVSLPQSLIQSFAVQGSVVLDPFAGSGSTLVAAKKLGFRSIGIEIEERYCETAVRRLAQGVLPLMEGGAA